MHFHDHLFAIFIIFIICLHECIGISEVMTSLSSLASMTDIISKASVLSVGLAFSFLLDQTYCFDLFVQVLAFTLLSFFSTKKIRLFITLFFSSGDKSLFLIGQNAILLCFWLISDMAKSWPHWPNFFKPLFNEYNCTIEINHF